MTSAKFSTIVCPGCSCLCDDIELSVTANEIIEVKNACEKGTQWFHAAKTTRSDLKPDLTNQINKVVDLINASKAPLLCGLDGLTTQAQKVAVALGRKISAMIDIGFDSGAMCSLSALRSQGKVTATLGEVATRSDLVLFWQCDPETTHPRLIERYCTKAKIVQVTDQANATSAIADEVINLDSLEQIRAIDQLRILANGDSLDNVEQQIEQLYSLMSAARYGTVFYGHGGDSFEQDALIENLFRLVRQLNANTRFVSLPLSGNGNQLSGENVLAWNSGFPLAVSFQNQRPQHQDRQFSAKNLLESNACDMALVCSTNSIDQLSPQATENLRSMPHVVLITDAHELETTSGISIPVSRPGIDGDGDWARLDDVLLPLSKPLASNREPAEFVLTRIVDRI